MFLLPPPPLLLLLLLLCCSCCCKHCCCYFPTAAAAAAAAALLLLALLSLLSSRGFPPFLFQRRPSSTSTWTRWAFGVGEDNSGSEALPTTYGPAGFFPLHFCPPRKGFSPFLRRKLPSRERAFFFYSRGLSWDYYYYYYYYYYYHYYH